MITFGKKEYLWDGHAGNIPVLLNEHKIGMLARGIAPDGMNKWSFITNKALILFPDQMQDILNRIQEER